MAQKRAEGIHQQYILEHFMKDFIEGKIKDQEKINLFCKQFHFRVNQKMKVVIMIPKLFAIQEKKVENNRFYTLKNMCMNIIDRNNLGLTFSDKDNLIVVALFCQKDKNADDKIIKMIVNRINEKLKIRPNLFIGCSIRGFRNLYISYNNARNKIERKLGIGSELIKLDIKSSRLDLFQDVFQEFKSGIAASVDNKDRLLHILERFNMAVESYNLSKEYTISCYFELLTTVYYAYFKETGNVFDEKLSSFLTAVNNLKREEIIKLAEVYLCKIFENNDEEEHELIRKAKKIIKNNLENDITITFIADNLCITSNYLSKLFKQITGEGCKDYIVRKRIDKAKILLETTTLNVGEIAAMTGYNDANYFSAVFKKHIGSTPSEFRRSYQV
ncbi:MAG: helix-turn-helix transcriptional regulator [Clostridiales bacterium]|nr:helix-turn-helix transcriptional regulator [Clostridiales bacterium]